MGAEASRRGRLLVHGQDARATPEANRADILRTPRKKGVRIGVADKLVAAAARRHGPLVATNDMRDFASAGGIEVREF
jgi:predicted nucleic acid-binding protein